MKSNMIIADIHNPLCSSGKNNYNRAFFKYACDRHKIYLSLFNDIVNRISNKNRNIQEAAAAVALLFFLQPEESNFLTASVVLEGETIAEYELSTLTGPVTLVVDEAPYPLTIQAEPGRIRIAESACPSQDCVHTGWISRAGQQIICLPDKLVISLSGSGSQEFDAISG